MPATMQFRIFCLPVHHLRMEGRAIAQAVSRRLFTVEARVRAHISPFVVDKVALE
jgi:hypothetical protein